MIQKITELASDHWNRVRDFISGIPGQVTPDTPCVPELDVRKLRAALVLEKAVELIEGLGFDIDLDPRTSEPTLIERHDPNLIKIIDGAADVSVVVTGTLVSCGIPDLPFIDEVDKNNLLKLTTGIISPNGKLTKSPGHQPPRIAGVLDNVTYRLTVDLQEAAEKTGGVLVEKDISVTMSYPSKIRIDGASLTENGGDVEVEITPTKPAKKKAPKKKKSIKKTPADVPATDEGPTGEDLTPQPVPTKESPNE